MVKVPKDFRGGTMKVFDQVWEDMRIGLAKNVVVFIALFVIGWMWLGVGNGFRVAVTYLLICLVWEVIDWLERAKRGW